MKPASEVAKEVWENLVDYSPTGYDLAACEEIVSKIRREAFEEAAKVCEKEALIFGSNEYSIGQPTASFSERFACGQCANSIRALAEREGE